MRALLLVTTLLPLLATWTPGAAATEREMQSFELNGVSLVDAEYLPFLGSEPFRYPDDVLFGFYAFGSTEAARACALRAYRQLKTFITADPDELGGALDAGATPFVYLWIDDYTDADPVRSRRVARLWHWNQNGRDYTGGFWKWEAVVTQSGTCVLPSAEQAREALAEAEDELSFAGPRPRR